MLSAFRWVCLVLFLSISGNVSIHADERGSATQAIQQVLDLQVAAWNNQDLGSFMKGYWKSEKLSFFSGGKRTMGWQATLERYQKRYQGEGKEMGKLRFTEMEIDLQGPDAALVRGRFNLVTSRDKPTGLFTLLFKKFPEGWLIVHDHSSAD